MRSEDRLSEGERPSERARHSRAILSKDGTDAEGTGRSPQNFGHRSPWLTGSVQRYARGRHFVVTDPDVPGRVRAKVLDFGIAKKPLSSGPNDFFTQYETREGVYTGTPHYMSPEQCHGGLEISAGTDVYSLGIILYQMVSGHPPFEANATGALLAMQQYEVPPSLEGQPGVSPELATLLVEMLQKKAEDRPSMRQVAERLEQLGLARRCLHQSTHDDVPAIFAQDFDLFAQISPRLM